MVLMLILTSIAGGHDTRVGTSTPQSGFGLAPNDRVMVREDLAEAWEKSGVARRIEASRETAALAGDETATLEAPKKKNVRAIQ